MSRGKKKLVLSGALFLTATQEVWAQGCSMCKTSLASFDSIASTINVGILILLFPPLLIRSSILFVAYRRGSDPNHS